MLFVKEMIKLDYIILTYTIMDMGGSIIYTRNKVEFLENSGWKVFVYSAHERGTVIVKDLEKFDEYIMIELKNPPYIFDDIELDRLTNSIISNITSETVIIESHTPVLSLWGELLADKLKAKHIIHSLTETYDKIPGPMISFLDFKHKRRELAGITKNSLSLLFKGYKVLKENEKYCLNAVCTNVVEDVDNDRVDNIEKLDINIGSITRLEKRFVQVLVDEVIIFADKNKEKNIQLVFFGDSKSKNFTKNIYKKVRDIDNLNVIVTGFLYPIPRKIFELTDVFVSVAGSATITAREGIPTIAVDVMDSKPIGILGYDTSSSLYRDNDKYQSISEVLEKFFSSKKIDAQVLNINEFKLRDYNEEFLNHMKFIKNSDQTKIYYRYNIKLTNKDRIKKILVSIIKMRNYNRILKNELIIKLYNKTLQF